MIKNGHGISVLAACSGLDGPASSGWPTWVPRWTEAGSAFCWERGTKFSAGSLQPAQVHRTGQTTRVSVYMYDSIHFRSVALHVRSNRIYRELAEFVNDVTRELQSPCCDGRDRFRDAASHHRLKTNIAHLLLCDPDDHPGYVFIQSQRTPTSVLDRSERRRDTADPLKNDSFDTALSMLHVSPRGWVRHVHWEGHEITKTTFAERFLRRFIGERLEDRGMPYFNYLMGKDNASVCVVALDSRWSRDISGYEKRPYGYVMGLAPVACRPGDKVAIIKGARAPFILRKRASGEYWNLGQAYIRGIMRGEVVEKLTDDDFRQINIV
jgi:hypothetical protein